MLQHLRPQYAKAFRCIGSDCEDTCCHGLDVVIDRDRYRKITSIPGLQAQEHFVVLNHPTDSGYARIKPTSSLTCPFFSADRLCSIQKEHGEHNMPEICATYPRLTQRIDGLRETALLLSCPEAARLVLLDPNLLLPDENATPKLPRYQRFARNAGPGKANGSPHQYLWDIREFTLLLIKDRAYHLWERLFLLGLFCRRLNEITAGQRLELVPELLKQYAEILAQGTLRPSMDSIPVRTSLQLGVVLEVLNRQLGQTDASHVRFRECVQEFLHAVHFEPGAPLEACVRFYEEACSRYYRPFMEQYPFVMENYLVNYVFRTRFPYGVDAKGNASDPLTEYLLMCLFFTAIKALLIGAAGHYQAAFGPEHVVKVVQSFAKAVEQCPDFQISKYLGLATADGMALLLKN
jgi:lysine-N-methylase